MVQEIQARTLLAHVRQPDPWFGLRYNMNLYRGCQHQCIYCDSRSECYGIDDFTDIRIKVNALDLLKKEIVSKRVKGTIGTGSMNDPYMPLEATVRLTGRALEIIAQHRFPVHVITKSDLVLRDLDLLREINRVYAAVSLTITAADDELARKVEPGAPVSSRRFRALEKLSAAGITAGVTLMPVLPFIEDNEENIAGIVKQAAASGAKYILPAFGMTLRDRQREYYYIQLDRLFPGLRLRYQRQFGERYSCASPQAGRLEERFTELCAQHKIATRIPQYQHQTATQPKLL